MCLFSIWDMHVAMLVVHSCMFLSKCKHFHWPRIFSDRWLFTTGQCNRSRDYDSGLFNSIKRRSSIQHKSMFLLQLKSVNHRKYPLEIVIQRDQISLILVIWNYHELNISSRYERIWKHSPAKMRIWMKNVQCPKAKRRNTFKQKPDLLANYHFNLISKKKLFIFTRKYKFTCQPKTFICYWLNRFSRIVWVR